MSEIIPLQPNTDPLPEDIENLEVGEVVAEAGDHQLLVGRMDGIGTNFNPGNIKNR